MLIESIQVEGYRRIGKLEVRNEAENELNLASKVTVLYGPNSSGKSSILYAILTLLRYIYGVEIEEQSVMYLKSIEYIHCYTNDASSTVKIGGKVRLPYHNDGMSIFVEIGSQIKTIQSNIGTIKIPTRRWFRIEDVEVVVEASGFKINQNGNLICERDNIYAPIPPYNDSFLPLMSKDVLRRDGFLEIIQELSDRKIGGLDKLNCVYKIVERYVNTLDEVKSEILTTDTTIDTLVKKSIVRVITVKDKSSLIREVSDNVKKLIAFGLKSSLIQDLLDDLNYVYGDDFYIDDIVIKEDLIYITSGKSILRLNQLSEGILNVMRILLAAHLAKMYIKVFKDLGIELPSSLLMIENPDFNIHVDWLVRLMDTLYSIDYVQVIVETHNGMIIGWAIKNMCNVYYLKPKGNDIVANKVSRDHLTKRTLELFERELRAYQDVMAT